MGSVKVDGQYLEINIAEELSAYPWEKARWSSDKLIAASPFRYDKSPSFFVDLRTGGFHDSGAHDNDYESGNFPKLLAFLRNETYEETCDYLTSIYGITFQNNYNLISINNPCLHRDYNRNILNEEITLKTYNFQHEYLRNRKITDKVQRFMGVGYDKKSQAVTLPWRYPDEKLANIKYRKIQGKVFWYARNAEPIRNLVYGIDKVYKHDLKEVVICEAEIDVLSWLSCGKPAIALGGTTVTDQQLDIIRKSPIETLTLAMDNDDAGRKMQRSLVRGLRGYLALSRVVIPLDYKDANDALVGGVDLSELRTDNLDNLFNRNIKV